MKAQVQKGFTLIELMIVVAIIGILAAVAIPLYSDYTQRARASTGMAALNSYKTAVALCYQSTGALAGCSSNGTVPNEGDPALVTQIPEAITSAGIVNGLKAAAANDGVITATLEAQAEASGDITVTLAPTIGNSSNLNWEIGCSDTGADTRVDGCTQTEAAAAALAGTDATSG